MTNQKQSTHIVLAKAEKNFNSEIDESSRMLSMRSKNTFLLVQEND